MKYYQQLDISDCGAACLAMIASKYDKYSSIAKIRETACTDIIGTNLKGMLQAGENLGFKHCVALVTCNLDKLRCIIKVESENKKLSNSNFPFDVSQYGYEVKREYSDNEYTFTMKGVGNNARNS